MLRKCTICPYEPSGVSLLSREGNGKKVIISYRKQLRD
jgi:hypothetical protein